MDILFAFSKRREEDLHRIEPIVQVLTETPLLESLLHLYIGSSHNTHIGFARSGVPYADKLPIFQDPQESYLCRKR